ncbi:phage head closure protein [uncultured Paracoccus sp.]|uniref:phage head closure protein n=1 Tax=uncultured Paracoccus sp. TaxID=189685 RepID=UPI0025E350FD|nr:phage head closure protein [uncultured Paracoccus sp.]
MRAGQLTKWALFQRPEKGVDANRNRILSYVDAFEVAVNLLPLKGTETVMAARMISRSPAIITVNAASDARLVTNEWRVIIDGRVYDVREDPRETQDRGFLEMLVEAVG